MLKDDISSIKLTKNMGKSSFLIAGKHAVTEALKNPNRKVLRVYLTEDSKRKIHQGSQNLNLLKNIKIFYKSKREMDNLCSSNQISHQGMLAEIEPMDDLNLKDYLETKKDQKKLIFVALEDVTDPRNIGSIIRSAASFNIDGLIIKKRSFPSSSKLMYKSSSGSIEHFNIFRVSNTNTALKYLKSKGFWICGFDSKSNNDFTKHDWNDNYVLLFGSEGYGLKYQTSKKTDFLFKIDINNKIESLNISNTASIVFHHLSYLKKNSS